MKEGFPPKNPSFERSSSQEQAPRPGETNYYFYNARYYDPEIARFVTADNLVDNESDTQGWNRFSYVKGNPVVYKDPTGHLADPFSLVLGVNAAAGKYVYDKLTDRADGKTSDAKYFGINPKDLKEEYTINIKLLKQKTLYPKEKWSNGGCWFSSILMAVEGRTKKSVDLNAIYDSSMEEGYIRKSKKEGAGPFVKDHNGLAELAGLENAKWSGFKKAGRSSVKNMVHQLNKGNPVIIKLESGHKEVLYGYTYKEDKLIFKVHDPGYYNDNRFFPKNSCVTNIYMRNRKVENYGYFK